jgi:hypothetical protein
MNEGAGRATSLGAVLVWCVRAFCVWWVVAVNLRSWLRLAGQWQTAKAATRTNGRFSPRRHGLVSFVDGQSVTQKGKLKPAVKP